MKKILTIPLAALALAAPAPAALAQQERGYELVSPPSLTGGPDGAVQAETAGGSGGSRASGGTSAGGGSGGGVQSSSTTDPRGSGGSLPFTGLDLGAMLAAGLLLAGSGVILRRAGRADR